MSEEPLLGDTRTVYEQIAIALLMGFVTVMFAIHREPSWIDAERLAELVEQDAMLVDLRPAFVSASSSRQVPGSVSFPASELASRLDELPTERPIVVFGTAGNDSLASYRLLKQRGFDVYDLGPVTRYPRRGGHRHDHDHEH